MRQVSDKLVEVEGTEGTITFTQGNVCGVFVSKRLFEAAENAASISRTRFVDHGGSRFPRVFLSAVARIVTYDNHASDQGMGLKILHRFENRFFVIIRGEQTVKRLKGRSCFSGQRGDRRLNGNRMKRSKAMRIPPKVEG